ncbi:hypothetical protein HMPREF3162_00125 [Brevibacterium sp. HMSC07C04]|nr:hypothetical protein HMPREF3162_00125 [Brevibacterium sp. HMSC07C04]
MHKEPRGQNDRGALSALTCWQRRRSTERMETMTPTNPPSLNDAVREAVTMRPIPREALRAGAKAAADVAMRRHTLGRSVTRDSEG